MAEPPQIEDTRAIAPQDYSTKSRAELIAICKEKNIKGYSAKKKDDIIKLICSENALTVKNGGLIGPMFESTESGKLTISEIHDNLTLPLINKHERINRLKERLILANMRYDEQILRQPTLKDAHVYCIIYGVSSQQYGPLLEKYIIVNFGFTRNKVGSCEGDCLKNGKNIEIKVSLGGSSHTKFNFVQIRPSHACDIYVLTAYYLSIDNAESEGELFIFKIPKEDIKKIIISHGAYAHGTIKEHGEITIQSLNDEKNVKEYAIRPVMNDSCWKQLMQFRVSEKDL